MCSRVQRSLLRPILVLAVVLPALCTGVVSGLGAAPASAADDQGSPGPLRVTLTSLSPAVLTRTGSVRMTGTVTNTTRTTWSDVNVHAWASTTPIGDRTALEEALTTPYDAEIGERLTTENAFVTVGDLAAGTSAAFTLDVPRDEIPIPDQAGVYWLGVHALGTSSAGRDSSADGRARTFIPVLPEGTGASSAVPATLVLPLRAPVRRDVTGHLRSPQTWGDLLSDKGRLGRLLGLAESGTGTGPQPTLLVDPAVLDAAGVLSRGNDDPADDPAAGTSTSTDGSGGGDGTDGAGTADESTDGSGGTGSTGTRGSTPATPADTATATSWLSSAETLARRVPVLGLGYADPDVASLAARAPRMLAQSRSLGEASFAARRITARPAVVPTDGVLPESALTSLGLGTDVVLSSAAAPDTTLGTGRTSAGQPLVLTDPVPASPGPGPGSNDALAVRQRILAEAALRLQEGDRSPMTVLLPRAWDPGPAWQSSAFLASLDQPWLRWGPLATAQGGSVQESAQGSTQSEIGPLRYPAAARKAQVGGRLVEASRSVVRAADVLAQTLPESSGVVDGYQRLALQAVSYQARGTRDASYDDATALAAGIRQRLSGVRVVGSPFVTLAGASGSFVVSVVNDLDRTVRIGIRVRTSPDLRVTVPRTITLLPGKRTTVPVRASSDRTGVRDVVLSPTTVDGDPIGTSLDFRLRTSQVSALIWAVLGGGGLLLVVMIGRRLVRRARGTG